MIRASSSLFSLRELVKTTRASAVFWNRCYEPAVVQRDMSIKKSLAADEIHVESFNGSLLFEAWRITNNAGKPFHVFTPFWKTCLTPDPGSALPTPGKIPGPRRGPHSLPLAALGLEPRVNWAGGNQSAWKPGCDGAKKRLRAFLRNGLARYPLERSRLEVDGSLKLSPYLRFGEISPRQVWHAVKKRQGLCPEGPRSSPMRGSGSSARPNRSQRRR